MPGAMSTPGLRPSHETVSLTRGSDDGESFVSPPETVPGLLQQGSHALVRVVSRDMEPAIHAGDIVRVVACPLEALECGQVLLLRGEGGSFHLARIVTVSPQGPTTCVDTEQRNRGPWAADEVLGRVEGRLRHGQWTAILPRDATAALRRRAALLGGALAVGVVSSYAVHGDVWQHLAPVLTALLMTYSARRVTLRTDAALLAAALVVMSPVFLNLVSGVPLPALAPLGALCGVFAVLAVGLFERAGQTVSGLTLVLAGAAYALSTGWTFTWRGNLPLVRAQVQPVAAWLLLGAQVGVAMLIAAGASIAGRARRAPRLRPTGRLLRLLIGGATVANPFSPSRTLPFTRVFCAALLLAALIEGLLTCP